MVLNAQEDKFYLIGELLSKNEPIFNSINEAD